MSIVITPSSFINRISLIRVIASINQCFKIEILVDNGVNNLKVKWVLQLIDSKDKEKHISIFTVLKYRINAISKINTLYEH